MSGAGTARRGGFLALTLALLTGCGGSAVSAGAVQQSVRDGLAGQGVEIRSVSCPEGVEARVGATVVCQVELWDQTALGEPVDRIRVVVKEARGEQVRYRLEPLAVGVPDDAQTTPAPDRDDAVETSP